MRPIYCLPIFLLSIFSLSACHGSVGNVIPESGSSMEDVYDSMATHKNGISHSSYNNQTIEADVKKIHQAEASHEYQINYINTLATTTFRQLPNPTLKLYIYPHFAGSDQIPIPGYFTELSAYEKTHYVLPSETIF